MGEDEVLSGARGPDAQPDPRSDPRNKDRRTRRLTGWLIAITVVSVIVWAAAIFVPFARGPLYDVFAVVFYVVLAIDVLLAVGGLICVPS